MQEQQEQRVVLVTNMTAWWCFMLVTPRGDWVEFQHEPRLWVTPDEGDRLMSENIAAAYSPAP